MKIANRTFILSGGSSGLGLSCLEELLGAGAYVAVLDLRPPPKTISGGEASSRMLFVSTDVTKSEQIQQGVDRAAEWTKKTEAWLGGIINCAGTGTPALIVDRKGKAHPKELWDHTIAVNLHGTFNLSRLGLEHLVKVPPDPECDGERGVIIMISSEGARDGPPGVTAYAAAKGAVETMTLPMARDCARYGIRVVTIAPGLFTTPLTDRFPKRLQRELMEQGVLHPKRYGIPREFASTVRWILENGYINAEIIRVNGGGRIPALM